MPNRQFTRLPIKFNCKGLKLNAPTDLMPEGKYPFLQNVRAYIDGSINTRPGLSLVGTADAATPLHSIKALRDQTLDTTIHFMGNGTAIYRDIATPVSVSTGWSGNPLFMIPHRPTESPRTYMYVADSAKMKKFKYDGTEQNWGIAALNVAPNAALSNLSYKTISDCNATTESAVAWANGGTAGAITAPDRLAATAITAVLYDTGTTGWACVIPASLTSDVQPGMLFTTAVTTAETTQVRSIYNPIFTTTIGSISYDSGTTGLCSIQFAVPTEGLVRDSVVQLGGATEYVRILSVTSGQDGFPSIRCSTVGTHAAADAVTGQRSFRAFFVNTHNATTTISTKSLASSLTGSGIGTLSHTLARDLSNTGSRPITDEDEIHISVKVSDLTKLTEGKILFDVDGTTPDFTRNYFFHAFRANDLVPATEGTITTLAAQQRIRQRAALRTPGVSIRNWKLDPTTRGDLIHPEDFFEPAFDEFGPLDDDPGQTVTGDNQWTEVIVKVGRLGRVGADSSRTLRDCAAIQVWFNTTDSIDVSIDAWWIGGTYGLDGEYLYCSRPRASATGVIGNPSPPTRSAINASRQSISVSTSTHSDSQVDYIDFFRQGGLLLEWHYVGSAPNSGTPTLSDELPDEQVVQNPTLEFDNFQPFPIADIPRTGVCDVKGTTVTRTSGDTFDTTWARGSLIIINGIAHALYASPTSTSRLEIEDSGGTLSSVTFSLPAATKLAQPISSVWGPYGEGFTGIFLFGCKNDTLYWTKGNNPDSAPDSNKLEVTSGSEKLINGCIYDGRPYLFSNLKQFGVVTIPTDEGGLTFQAQEVANSKGLASRTGICVGDKIYFVGFDGIYSTEGSAQPQSITDADLYTLFPHDGLPGSVGNTIYPPDYTYPEKMQLEYADKMVYFDYQDTQGSMRTLVYDTINQGWFYDKYTPTIYTHYYDETPTTHLLYAGSINGKIYKLVGGTIDPGGVMVSGVTTPVYNMGDTRAHKRFSEVMIDALSAVNISANVQYSYGAVSEGIAALIPAAIRVQNIINLNSGVGRIAANISLDLAWNGAAELYEWQPSYYLEPETTTSRIMDWENGGTDSAKWLQGCRIYCDTSGVDKTVLVFGDDDLLIASLTVNSDGKAPLPFSWAPQITHYMRLVPTGGDWKFFSVEWVFEPEPELTEIWTTQPTTHGLPGYKFLRDGYISLRSTTSSVLTISYDGVDYDYAIASTGGEKRKLYLVLDPAKGKEIQYSLVGSAGLRLYKNDCEFKIKPWGSSEGYLKVNPFGENSPGDGATI